MTRNRVFGLVVVLIAALLLAACGGGGSTVEPVEIVSITVSPDSGSGTVPAGSVVELSANINAPGRTVSNLTKNWTVSAGTVSVTPPDFSLSLRQMAKTGSASSVSTTSNKVYWAAPATTGQATITLNVEGESKDKAVSVGSSPVVISITDGSEGKKVVSVQAKSVTDLYQAAFRINFSSAWTPTAVDEGNFLKGGSETPDDILSIGLTDQNGFVPVALTRLGNVAGIDGSGELASVTFSPASSGSSIHGVSELPFTVDMIVLLDSEGRAIE